MKKRTVPPKATLPLDCHLGERTSADILRSFSELQRLNHELNVRQYELEMQNEELLRVRDERGQMETQLGKYCDFYDFAPVGYFNLNSRGLILTVNLTGSGFLGENRRSLINRSLDSYLSQETRPAFRNFLAKVFTCEGKQSCEVVLLKEGYPPIYALMEALISESGKECTAVMVDITERKLAEEAHERLAAIVRTTDDAIIAKDLNGLILDWNVGAERLFGYSASEIVNKPITLLIPPELHGEDDHILSRLLSGEKVDHFETVRLSKGGRRINVSVTVSLLRKGGLIVGASKIARDITERKQAEEYGGLSREVLQILNGLADPQELIRLVLASIKNRTGFHAVGFRFQDRDDVPYPASQGFPKDFLLTDNTLIERSDIGDACRDKTGNVSLECTCGLVISGKTDSSSKGQHFSRGGSFWTNDSSSLLDVPSGQDPRTNPRNLCVHLGYASVALVPIRSKERIIGLIQLNDRRKGRLSLGIVELMEGIGSHIGAALVRKQTEERHRTVLRTAMDGFWLLDTQGGLVEVNETYCQMSGFSAQELLTMCISDLETPETVDVTISHIKKVMAQGEDRFESRHRHKDGSVFDVEISMQYRAIEGGRLVVFLRDVTAKKQAELDKIRLEEQLLHAQKLESVGRLAGGVAHDFNNMLCVILGHANLALMELDPVLPLHANLEEVRKAAEKSADLTRQLLAFARKQTVAPKVLNLNETVAGMLKMLNRLLGEDVKLDWQPEADLWSVNIDPSQLDQILANLCVNARDAILDVGKITIETGNCTIDDDYCSHNLGFTPGDYVSLSVSDNGCGMDKEMVSHIFEPFFTTKGVGKGTGLGLATVYCAVKQNNGVIHVYSEPGLGTTFLIYLPRYEGNVVPARSAFPEQAAQCGKETILLVEDESAILDLTVMILTRLGYTVLAASSPSDAINLAREHREISLLVTDVVMPEMNGLDLAKALAPINPGMKNLFMSGFTANVIAHHGVLDDGVIFIQKPFSIHALSAKVREALDGSSR